MEGERRARGMSNGGRSRLRPARRLLAHSCLNSRLRIFAAWPPSPYRRCAVHSQCHVVHILRALGVCKSRSTYFSVAQREQSRNRLLPQHLRNAVRFSRERKCKSRSTSRGGKTQAGLVREGKSVQRVSFLLHSRARRL